MRVLQVIWDGGGNTAPQLGIVRELVGRGHEVRILGHRCQRERCEAAGARFSAFRHAPDGDASSRETDLIRDWEARTPIGAFAKVRDRVMYGPAERFARDVVETLDGAPADVVVWDYLLLGAGVGAERAGVPSAAVIHTVYPLPAPGVPPFGLGLAPARGAPGRARDALLARAFAGQFRPGLRALNAARAAFALPAMEDPFAQVTGADLVLVLTAPALDYAADELPANVRYAGPVVERTPAEAWESPWAPDDPRPLVLASFSTTFMDQDELARRTVAALGRLPVRGLLTTGPAIDPAALDPPQNVAVRPFVPHAAVLPEASLVITHGGLGTVHAALAAGVPLLCIPHGRDQDDVAARVVFRGAGIRARRTVRAGKLQRLVSDALGDASLREGAARLARAFADEDGAALSADALEALAR